VQYVGRSVDPSEISLSNLSPSIPRLKWKEILKPPDFREEIPYHEKAG
jgi:hypothetical protein